MSLSKGDVVLLPYPFTDLKSVKVRPAVVVASATGPYSDIFVAPLTSKLAALNTGEFTLSDWVSACLNVPSAVKRGVCSGGYRVDQEKSRLFIRQRQVGSRRRSASLA
jgi:mRNA interferase MazF